MHRARRRSGYALLLLLLCAVAVVTRMSATPAGGRAPRLVPMVGHQGGAGQVVFSADGSTIASCGFMDGRVCIWDADSGRLRVDLEASGARPAVSLSADGSEALVVTDCVEVWDARRGVKLRTMPLPGSVGQVAAEGDRTLVIDGKAGVRVFASDPWRQVGAFTLSAPVGRVVLSPSGRLFVSGASEKAGQAVLWETDTGRCLGRLSELAANAPPVFSRDGRMLALGGPDRKVRIWDAGRMAIVVTLAHPWLFPACAMAFSPDGATLAVEDGSGKIWLRQDGCVRGILRTANPFGMPVTGLWFSADGQRLMASFWCGTPQAFDAGSLTAMGTPDTTQAQFMAAAPWPGRDVVAFANTDGTVRLHRIRDARVQRILGKGQDDLHFLAYHPREPWVALGRGFQYGGVLHLVDLSGARAPRTLAVPERPNAAVFSPDPPRARRLPKRWLPLGRGVGPSDRRLAR